MSFCNFAHRMGTDSEEGIADIWNDHADFATALLPQQASHFIRNIAQFRDGPEHSASHLVTNIHGSVQHARNRHRANAGLLGDVTHACRSHGSSWSWSRM